MPHSILLYKLWSIGVTGSLWHWFKCYLSNRHHFVQLETHSSSLLSVKSGVPQGSILGPLLFLIFVNDLPERISYSSLLLFADDSKIQNAISSSDDIAHLQSDIDALVSWTYTNSLFLNSKSVRLLGFRCRPMQVIHLTLLKAVIFQFLYYIVIWVLWSKVISPGPLITTSFAPKRTVFCIEFTAPSLLQLLSLLKNICISH